MNHNRCAGLRSLILPGMLSTVIAMGMSGCGKTQMRTAGPEVQGSAAIDTVAISALRERAIERLIEHAEGPVPLLRANALEALSITPMRVEPLLGRALQDENTGVRSTAAVIVGKRRLNQLAAGVRPLLNDSSPFVRASAIYALVRCGEVVDQTPLAGLLLGNPSPRVRAHVAFLLGEMGDESALGMLKEAARTPVPRAPAAEVRLMQIQLAEAMAKLGEASQIESIRAALYPSRPEELETTALAAQVIGQLADRGAIDELVVLTALVDEQGNRMPGEVRLAAAGSLAQLGLRRGSFIAEEYASHEMPALRAQAAFVYGEIGAVENLDKLERMMEDRDGLVQVAAAAAVLKIASGPGVRTSR